MSVKHYIVFNFRGTNNGEVTAFRSVYGSLSEIRSFLSSSTPVVTLTATPNCATVKVIQSSLLRWLL